MNKINLSEVWKLKQLNEALFLELVKDRVRLISVMGTLLAVFTIAFGAFTGRYVFVLLGLAKIVLLFTALPVLRAISEKIERLRGR